MIILFLFCRKDFFYQEDYLPGIFFAGKAGRRFINKVRREEENASHFKCSSRLSMNQTITLPTGRQIKQYNHYKKP
jgi:hypothetical protein